MPISLTSDTTITSNAAQTPERWSAEWLRTYLAESAQDPIAGVQALATELRALAEDDLPEALHRAQALRDIGTERWQFSRSVTSESCLTEVRNLARTFSITPVNGRRVLPTGGHRFSPVAAMFSPHWWPRVLPVVWGFAGSRWSEGRRP
jgi:hypothetical protein